MAAPYSDEEIEQLFHREPLNQAAFLPAEETNEENNEQIESNR